MHLDASDPVSTVTPHPSYMHLTGEITEGENEIYTSLKGEKAQTSLSQINLTTGEWNPPTTRTRTLPNLKPNHQKKG